MSKLNEEARRVMARAREAEKAREQEKEKLEYREFRKKMLSLSLEERSRFLRFAKLIWQANCDLEMPEDIKKEIVARQLTYFTQNPACIYANPAIYRDLIPQRRETPTRSGFTPISGIVGAGMLQIIANAIALDLRIAARG